MAGTGLAGEAWVFPKPKRVFVFGSGWVLSAREDLDVKMFPWFQAHNRLLVLCSLPLFPLSLSLSLSLSFVLSHTLSLSVSLSLSLSFVLSHTLSLSVSLSLSLSVDFAFNTNYTQTLSAQTRPLTRSFPSFNTLSPGICLSHTA